MVSGKEEGWEGRRREREGGRRRLERSAFEKITSSFDLVVGEAFTTDKKKKITSGLRLSVE